MILAVVIAVALAAGLVGLGIMGRPGGGGWRR
jgi:hypothetical protein